MRGSSFAVADPFELVAQGSGLVDGSFELVRVVATERLGARLPG